MHQAIGLSPTALEGDGVVVQVLLSPVPQQRASFPLVVADVGGRAEAPHKGLEVGAPKAGVGLECPGRPIDLGQ